MSDAEFEMLLVEVEEEEEDEQECVQKKTPEEDCSGQQLLKADEDSQVSVIYPAFFFVVDCLFRSIGKNTDDNLNLSKVFDSGLKFSTISSNLE